MTDDRKPSATGLEACGFIFDALVKILAVSGVQPDAGPGYEEYDNAERRVIAYLKRRARERDEASSRAPARADTPPQGESSPRLGAPTDPEVTPRAEAAGARPISLARVPRSASGAPHRRPSRAVPVSVTFPAPIGRPGKDDQAAASSPGITPIAVAPKVEGEVSEKVRAQEVGSRGAPAAASPGQATGPASAPVRDAEAEKAPDDRMAPTQGTDPDEGQPGQDALPKEGIGSRSRSGDGVADQAENPVDELKNEEASGMVYGPSGIPKIDRTPPEQPERVSLPNARSNTPYEALIEGYSELRLRGTAPEGLTITPEGRVLAKAMSAGEYKMEVGALKNGRSVTLLVRLSVVPRPEDLWVSIPSDQQAPLAKPDEAFAAVRGHTFMVAASKRGRSHAKEGSYRDDHFALKVFPKTGWHVMVVADGAGSARLSREGSRVACEEVIKVLDGFLSQFMEPEIEAIVNRLRAASTDEETRANQIIHPASNTFARAAYMAAEAIARRAEDLGGCRPSDLSTTLVIAAARPVRGGWLFASFSVGDGGVAIWDEEAGEVTLMGRPDSGEFAGQTRFLASDEFKTTEGKLDRVFVTFRERFTAFVAMTDGITDPKFETDAGLSDPDRWHRFWAEDFARQVDVSPGNPDLERQFLGWLDFWSRGNHDDRTLAVMVPLQDGRETDRGGA
ncbi:PP2C family serine/threonine-protein phosphatase [Salipiger marinus]|uniref:Protein phosphatase 2C n=1 Tax=Salipiger marinus TaxID=555512 RepID=A0A1G8UTD8_9RHOB|nr:PP2C family serine/threonine-protein phosphatase [Salipiger marinus]SDJ56220.1 Protein phosphatase 2C [Salipiger marinus]